MSWPMSMQSDRKSFRKSRRTSTGRAESRELGAGRDDAAALVSAVRACLKQQDPPDSA